jgi:hypothetical protein
LASRGIDITNRSIEADYFDRSQCDQKVFRQSLHFENISRDLMKGFALILAAFFALVPMPVMAESYDLTMGPFQVKFDTIQALDTRIAPSVAFEKFTGLSCYVLAEGQIV